jgi:hypothetical protein
MNYALVNDSDLLDYAANIEGWKREMNALRTGPIPQVFGVPLQSQARLNLANQRERIVEALAYRLRHIETNFYVTQMYDDRTNVMLQSNIAAANALNAETRHQFVNSVVLGTALAKNILGYTPRVFIIDVDYHAEVAQTAAPVPGGPTPQVEADTMLPLVGVPTNVSDGLLYDQPPDLTTVFEAQKDSLEGIRKAQAGVFGYVYNSFAKNDAILGPDREALALEAAQLGTANNWWEWIFMRNVPADEPLPVSAPFPSQTQPVVNSIDEIHSRLVDGCDLASIDAAQKPWLSALSLAEAALVLAGTTGNRDGRPVPGDVHAPVAHTYVVF